MNLGLQLRLCSLCRGIERLLPPGAILCVLWPLSATAAASWLLTHRRERAALRRSPLAAPAPAPRAWLRIWRARAALHAAKWLGYWPDRLRESCWRRRCTIIGLERVQQLLASNEAVILIGLHHGPYKMLRPWLRAFGLPVASLATTPGNGRPPHDQLLFERSDKANGMSDVPNLIHVRELRKVHQHLGCGRVLFVAAEAGRGKSILVRLGGLRFRMASGPLRLAQRTGAWVAPCLIRCEAGGRFKIQLGAPIPSELLADSSHHPRAARRLVRWFLPRLKSAPAQYDARHIRAWKARAAREGTEVAKVGAAC